MTAQVLFFNNFSEKDPYLNAAEQVANKFAPVLEMYTTCFSQDISLTFLLLHFKINGNLFTCRAYLKLKHLKKATKALLTVTIV